MNVTIIGAGNMGRGIGTRLVAGGHSVTFVDANPETAEKTAADVRTAAKDLTKVSTASLGDANLGDVVVLAVWYGTNIELAKQLGSKLAGKVVVDIANPLNSSFDGLATAPDSSSAEDVAKAIASGAKVVKAFNTTYAGTLLAGEVAGQPLDVFIAGDDADAKSKVAELVRDGGMRPVDVVAQGNLGTNWASTIKILS
jgi:predicted dinucleotide-binding enzyme